MSEQEADPRAARFAADLRMLRIEAGEPTFRVLASKTGYGRTTLNDALRGNRLPTVEVTLALVRACRGDEDQWRRRWVEVRRELDGHQGEQDKGGQDKPPATSPTSRPRLVTRVAAAAVLVVVLVVSGIHARQQVRTSASSDPPGQSCQLVRQYRVTTAGNVLAGNHEIVGTIVAGDLFNAHRTNGLPFYQHRYYGTIVRTGVWGYVATAKLQFLKNACL